MSSSANDLDAIELEYETNVPDICWEGTLVSSEIATRRDPSGPPAPKVSIGKPLLRSAAKALFDEHGKPFVRPQGDYHFFLIEIPCTLHPIEPPASDWRFSEAKLEFLMEPNNQTANAEDPTACVLFPQQEIRTDPRTVSFAITGPKFSFWPEDVEVGVGELKSSITYSKSYPVVESFGLGSSKPTWIFRSHPGLSLQGSQQVYAIIAVDQKAEGLRGTVHLTATMENVNPVNRVMKKVLFFINSKAEQQINDRLRFTIAKKKA